MAEEMTVKLSVQDRQYIVAAFVKLRDTLIRSRAKELPGSEIWVLRGKELEQIEVLSRKFHG